jgi:hypothetical protein
MHIAGRMTVEDRSGVRIGYIALAVVAVLGGASEAFADDRQQCLDAASQGQTLRDDHHLVDARSQFRACAQQACPAVVQRDCAAWLDDIERTLPTVVVAATDPGGSDLSAVRVTVDGRVLTEKLDGTELLVDPGQHAFTFEAAGQPPVARTLILKEGEKGRRVPVQIGRPESAPPAGATPAPTPPPPPVASPSPIPAPTTEPAAGPSPRATLGLVVGGVGVAGLVAGAIFGALAVSANNAYPRYCGGNIGAPSPSDCNSAGVQGRNDAFAKATASTALFIGGGALAAAGAVIYLTAPRGAGPAVGIGPGSVLLESTF